jgi:LPXTG-motif cell wall-anchored protein
MKRFRVLLMVGLVACWGFAMAGSASAQPGENGVPIDAPEDCVENVMDLPALNVCKDAQGRHLLDLPAIGTLREPLPAKAPTTGGTGKLPKTGMHTEDFMAIGGAALAAGFVLLRRLRLAVS